jgi:hypothetical protein
MAAQSFGDRNSLILEESDCALAELDVAKPRDLRPGDELGTARVIAKIFVKFRVADRDNPVGAVNLRGTQDPGRGHGVSPVVRVFWRRLPGI